MDITIAELKELLKKVTDKLNNYVFQELESDFDFDFKIKPRNEIEAEITELETAREVLISALNLAKLHTTVDIDIYDDVSKISLGEAYRLRTSLFNQGTGLGNIFIKHTKKGSDTAKEIAKLLTQIAERYLIINNAIEGIESSTHIEINLTQEQIEKVNDSHCQVAIASFGL